MQKHLLPILLLVASITHAQSPILFGMTSAGGQNNLGTIFSFNTADGIKTVQYSFDGVTGEYPNGSLMMASNGILYGMTEWNSPNLGPGVVFSCNINTHVFTDLHNFGSGADGIWPTDGLIQASDSLLYGMTGLGGIYYPANQEAGTLFNYNIYTGLETVLHSFGSYPDGAGPSGTLIQANNGLLYGMTAFGGMYDTLNGGGGTLFSYDITAGLETVLHNFGKDSDGSFPDIDRLLVASNGLLYGLASKGGSNGGGIIFNYNTNTGAYSVVHNFGNTMEEFSPISSLVQASNGLLYGITSGGGGTLFSFNIADSVETVVHVFGIGADGAYPGSIIQASNGIIYGVTGGGGMDSVGAIFSFDIATGTESILHNFNGTDGAQPVGRLLELDNFPTSVMPVSPLSNLRISPNPSTGQFTIQLPNTQSSYPAEVYNMLGQKIEQLTLSAYNNTLNLTNQPAGMYFIYLQTQTGRVGAKVVVER